MGTETGRVYAISWAPYVGPDERRTNEGTSELLRQHVPRQVKLRTVARQSNDRPRMTLENDNPAEHFNACVALTSWDRRDLQTLTHVAAKGGLRAVFVMLRTVQWAFSRAAENVEIHYKAQEQEQYAFRR